MKTIIKVDTPAKFFERGRAAARLAEQGKAIPLERVIAFEDPEDMARLITTAKLALFRARRQGVMAQRRGGPAGSGPLGATIRSAA